ncbi:MAG: hypothetical protein QME52_10285 [Bacteroidota bacterium]|nr:hypothetical protein [Bacteroidota bacterium]
MRCLSACILLIFSTLNLSIAGEASSISFYGSYTTSSKLFHHPDDVDESVRNQFFPLDNIISAGIDFRYSFIEDYLQVGLGIEYISRIKKFTIPFGTSKKIPVTDGFVVYPLEFTGYSSIPTGSDNWEFYLGGGGGMYIGTRAYEIANEKSITINKKLGWGIHILTGVQYRVFQNISLRSELKFRDVQFETTTKFATAETQFDGETIPLEAEPSTARFNIDGMTLNIGIALQF